MAASGLGSFRPRRTLFGAVGTEKETRFMPTRARHPTGWRRLPWLWRGVARRAARRWAVDLSSSDDWMLLDTETTGTGAAAEVIQVAVLHPSGTTLFEACARPEGAVPPAAQAIHGLSAALLTPALPFHELHRPLSLLLSGRRVVCFNAAFDARLLRQTAARYGLASPEVRWDCAMLAYASFRGDWSAERGDFRWHRLPGAAHGAAADCRATLDLIRHMASDPPRPWWRFW